MDGVIVQALEREGTRHGVGVDLGWTDSVWGSSIGSPIVREGIINSVVHGWWAYLSRSAGARVLHKEHGADPSTEIPSRRGKMHG
jgi:hypothetical protein